MQDIIRPIMFVMKACFVSKYDSIPSITLRILKKKQVINVGEPIFLDLYLIYTVYTIIIIQHANLVTMEWAVIRNVARFAKNQETVILFPEIVKMGAKVDGRDLTALRVSFIRAFNTVTLSKLFIDI